ncbi:MFS transporter [Bacillus tianshenii]|nr:MFS transporter [Bacillus tianshenii]
MGILKHEQVYRKLFYAGIINGVGDRFSQVAVLALLLKLTGSGMAVGIILAIKLIPTLFFSPLAGVLADRYSRKNILMVTDFARIFFALSFLFVSGTEEIWIIYVGTFFLSIGEAIYQPVRKAMIASVVHREYLMKVNVYEQVMVGVVLVIGSFFGGVLSYYLGEQITFLLNGFSFFTAGFFISRVHLNERKPTQRQAFIFHQLTKTLKIASPSGRVISINRIPFKIGDCRKK